MKKSRLMWAALVVPALAFAAPQSNGQQSGQQSGQQGASSQQGQQGQQQFGTNGSLTGQGGQQGQGQQMGQAAYGNPGQASGTQGVGSQAAVRGLVQGTVGNVNFSKGTLTLNTGNGATTIRGTPGQLQNFRKGEFTSIPFADYAGNRWLVSSPSQLQPQTFARAVTVTGVVKNVNKSGGKLMINRDGKTVTYNAHPQTLQSVLPGQFVSITYEQVGNVDWIQQLRAAQQQNAGAAPGGGGSQGGGSQGGATGGSQGGGGGGGGSQGGGQQ